MFDPLQEALIKSPEVGVIQYRSRWRMAKTQEHQIYVEMTRLESWPSATANGTEWRIPAKDQSFLQFVDESRYVQLSRR